LYPGTVLAHYTIGKVLGEGGFGIVYKAWDNNAGVPVAIKEYFPRGLVTRTPGSGMLHNVASSYLGEFEAGMQRFIREREGTGKIDMMYAGNPHLPHGVSYFDANGTAYMVMELFDGETLTERIDRQGAMAVSEALSMIYDVLGAVQDLHKAGVVHRDISPDNIVLCSDGNVKLFDLGAAKFGKSSKNVSYERVLKPGYSPPEQYDSGDRTGVYTDIYAVSATLYFALTGMKPEEATNRKELDILAKPQSIVPEIPKHVSDAILVAMAADHRLRYKSAEAFTLALKGAAKVVPLNKIVFNLKLRKTLTVASALIVLCCAATFAYFMLREQVPTLNDASFEVWYAISGDEAADSKKNAAFERIIWEFNEIYPNVRIDLVGIAAGEYDDKVETTIGRGEPVLFESDGMSRDMLAKTADINSVANKIRRDTLFLDGYTRLFTDRNQIPTGFAVTCVYINTTFSSYEDDAVADLTALLASMPVGASRIAVKSGLEVSFESTFGNVPYAAPEDFYTADAGAKFADTLLLYEVQSKLAGRYRLLRIDKSEVPAAFGAVFSIAGGSKNELNAMMRLLEFMLGENAQDAMHIQANSGFIPLNREAMETFRSVYPDFENFFVNTDNYVFGSN